MNKKIITFAVLGLGNRAEAYLNQLDRHFKNQYQVVAIADIDEAKLAKFQAKYNVDPKYVFRGYEEFVKVDKIADVVIIATLDDQHYIPAIDAIRKGYHIILEKPIAMNLRETLAIAEEAKKRPDLLIGVCHVLRHNPFFSTLKEIVDSKELGEVINIQHNENIGYFHFAHSYVRGNWRNDKIAAPLIVAKSCHDMDILLYLLGNKRSVRLSSFGSLSYFTHDKYDENVMAPHCIDCKIKDTCIYSALELYKDLLSTIEDENIKQYMLRNSEYSRCVYNCDNNIPDHQVTIIEFEDGITATFNLSAFTNYIHRSLKIMCEKGEIRATETTNEIEVHYFGNPVKKVIIPKENQLVKIDKGEHGGGDHYFIINYMNALLNNQKFESTLDLSVESHVMAFGAELSRVNNGQVVETQKLYEEELVKI